jgi:rod shape determining protein RodA
MKARHRKGLKRIDLTTFSIYLGLVVLGWLMIYSVGHHEMEDQPVFQTSAGKQAIWIGIAFFVFLMINLIDWKFWHTFAYLIYSISIGLLIGVLLFGINIKGSTSWFSFGGFSFQPSEIAKFGACLAMAGFLNTYNTDLRNPQHQLTAFGIFLLPAGLILLQPDAGSALVFFSFLIVLFREGLPRAYFIIGFFVATLFFTGFLFGPFYVSLALLLLSIVIFAAHLNGNKIWRAAGGLLLALVAGFLTEQGYYTEVLAGSVAVFLILSGVLWWPKKRSRIVGLLWTAVFAGAVLAYVSNHVFHNVLKPHQQDRLNVWLQPGKCDPRGSLYNVLQSKMAIGSGGIRGKGFLEGTMTKLNYVPEQSTDFIFCTIGEEHGFIGTFSIVGLFLLLLIRITIIAERQRSNFSRQYAYGVAGILFIHFFINIGMTMGLMPIIGIPLPFLSKGGSSLLGFTIMIAVLLKLDRHRYQI